MSASALKPGQFYGSVTRKLSFAGATLSEVFHPQARIVPRHSHDACYFSVLLSGAYRETFQRNAIDYNTHSAAFHPQGTVHSGEIGAAGGRLFAVELDSSWLKRVRDFVLPPSYSYHQPGGELAWLAARLRKEFRRGDAASRLAMEGILLEMLAEVSRRRLAGESGAPAWLAAAVELVRAEFQSSLALDEISRRVGVHPAHLSRVFRHKYGKTVGEFVDELRIQYAIEQFDRDVALSEIALAAGFADQSHFTRVFRRLTGATPARFRAARRLRPAGFTLRPRRHGTAVPSLPVLRL